MKVAKFVLSVLFLGNIAFAQEQLILTGGGNGHSPTGMYVFKPGQENKWPKTYMILAKDRGRNVPSVYLDYRFIVSDVMTPWTSSEYTGIRMDDGRLSLKKRRVDFAHLEFSNSMRNINGITMQSSCAVYDAQSQLLIAYCPQGQKNLLQVKNANHQLLGTIKKKVNANGWDIILEDSATQQPNKSIVIMIAGLHVF